MATKRVTKEAPKETTKEPKAEAKATSKPKYKTPETESVANAIQSGVILDKARVAIDYRRLRDRLRSHRIHHTEDGVSFDDDSLDAEALDELVASLH